MYTICVKYEHAITMNHDGHAKLFVGTSTARMLSRTDESGSAWYTQHIQMHSTADLLIC